MEEALNTPSICKVVISPGRAEPADESEIKMQILFGHLARILEVRKNWTKISIEDYEYECWVDTKHFEIVSEDEYSKIKSDKTVRVADITSSIRNTENKELTHLVKGCILPNYQGHKFTLGKTEFEYFGNTNENYSCTKENIEKEALSYLNSPYLWGGNSPYGIDCSGLMQEVYSLYGIQIPRDAYQQGTVGETINLIEESQPGDMAFFDNSEGRITHVGFILEGNKIIHASGHVRIDKIDHQGIFKEEIGKYTHKLRIIKRLINN